MNRLTQKFLSIVNFSPSSGEIATSHNNQNNQNTGLNKLISLVIIAGSLGITYYPLFNQTTTITIVTGSELKEPLEALELKFEEANPKIDLDIKIQGSQDIITNFINNNNDFTTTILMPANSELINELEDSLKAQGEEQIFYNKPEAIAKTILVGIAWEERGKILFPDQQFSWNNIENALKKRNWQDLGGEKKWGSFDFLTTDPLRSNSGQLSLNLWAKSELSKSNLTTNDLNSNEIKNLFTLIKNNIYQPPRSTDILLQEFIARGRNDVDVATVYESIALYRWLQVQDSQNQNYQIYYPNPSIETVITAVIPQKNVNRSTAKTASKFIDFLKEEEQQIILAQYGFRPIIKLDLNSIPNSPWNEDIPGMQINPQIKINSSPEPEIMDKIEQVWNRS